jgi:hypothetical protein
VNQERGPVPGGVWISDGDRGGAWVSSSVALDPDYNLASMAATAFLAWLSVS